MHPITITRYHVTSPDFFSRPENYGKSVDEADLARLPVYFAEGSSRAIIKTDELSAEFQRYVNGNKVYASNDISAINKVIETVKQGKIKDLTSLDIKYALITALALERINVWDDSWIRILLTVTNIPGRRGYSRLLKKDGSWHQSSEKLPPRRFQQEFLHERDADRFRRIYFLSRIDYTNQQKERFRSELSRLSGIQQVVYCIEDRINFSFQASLILYSLAFDKKRSVGLEPVLGPFSGKELLKKIVDEGLRPVHIPAEEMGIVSPEEADGRKVKPFELHEHDLDHVAAAFLFSDGIRQLVRDVSIEFLKAVGEEISKETFLINEGVCRALIDSSVHQVDENSKRTIQTFSGLREVSQCAGPLRRRRPPIGEFALLFSKSSNLEEDGQLEKFLKLPFGWFMFFLLRDRQQSLENEYGISWKELIEETFASMEQIYQAAESYLEGKPLFEKIYHLIQMQNVMIDVKTSVTTVIEKKRFCRKSLKITQKKNLNRDERAAATAKERQRVAKQYFAASTPIQKVHCVKIKQPKLGEMKNCIKLVPIFEDIKEEVSVSQQKQAASTSQVSEHELNVSPKQRSFSLQQSKRSFVVGAIMVVALATLIPRWVLSR